MTRGWILHVMIRKAQGETEVAASNGLYRHAAFVHQCCADLRRRVRAKSAGARPLDYRDERSTARSLSKRASSRLVSIISILGCSEAGVSQKVPLLSVLADTNLILDSDAGEQKQNCWQKALITRY